MLCKANYLFPLHYQQFMKKANIRQMNSNTRTITEKKKIGTQHRYQAFYCPYEICYGFEAMMTENELTKFHSQYSKLDSTKHQIL